MKRHWVPRGLLSVACLGLLASGAAAQTPAPAAAPAAPAPEAAAPPKAPAAPTPTPAAPPELAPWTATPGNEVAPSEAAATTGAAAAPAAPPSAAPPSAAPPKTAATSTEPASTAGARRTSPRAHSSAAPAALATPTAADLEPKDDPNPAPPTPVATTPSFDFSIGMGSQLVSHAGLDAFSDDNAVPEFQLGLSAALNELGWAQLAAVARAGFGGTSGTNRGQPTELGTTKLGLGAGLRAPAFERLYLFARVMPQAVHVSTELHETSSGVVLGRAATQRLGARARAVSAARRRLRLDARDGCRTDCQQRQRPGAHRTPPARRIGALGFQLWRSPRARLLRRRWGRAGEMAPSPPQAGPACDRSIMDL
jgi:hypothetical protein